MYLHGNIPNRQKFDPKKLRLSSELSHLQSLSLRLSRMEAISSICEGGDSLYYGGFTGEYGLYRADPDPTDKGMEWKEHFIVKIRRSNDMHVHSGHVD